MAYRRNARRPAADVRLEPERPLTRRALRTPQHTFRLQVRPWAIVPAAFLPVIPGETVKAASMKMRVLSKPIKDKLAGWWLETYLFYIRAGDLSDGWQSNFRAMILGGSSATTVSGGVPFYTGPNTADMLWPCYNACVKGYFRNEDGGEQLDTYDSGGDYYLAKVAGSNSAFDSAILESEMDDPVPDDADEWVKKWEAYQNIRQTKLTTATWEEYLAMQGVALPPQLMQTTIDRRPELLHFTRDWQFPVNAIEPSTGVPAALVQWSLADRLKRGRFIAEPGFILQLVLCRPKTLMKNQRGHMTGFVMGQQNSWMPTALDTDPHARLIRYGAGGPINGAVNPYWIDPADLLLRGDQFVNFDLGSTVAGALDGISYASIPVIDTVSGGDIGEPAVNAEYPTADDQDRLFVNSNANWIDVDGVTTFGIASKVAADVSGKRKGMA